MTLDKTCRYAVKKTVTEWRTGLDIEGAECTNDWVDKRSEPDCALCVWYEKKEEKE